jgi:fructose-bisphosphate aldolase class I
VLRAVYTDLFDQRVDVSTTPLKSNMVLSGYAAVHRAGHEEVSQRTLECLAHHVPAAVPGIVFLSGGQPEADARAHLNVNDRHGSLPWEVSFSFGRALQTEALEGMGGEPENAALGQSAYLRRARLNSAARAGRYMRDMQTGAHAG